jgi:putative chitinase
MFAFDQDLFFTDWPARSSLALTDARKDAVSFLLNMFEADTGFTMIRELAYVLATIRWETANTFEPVTERRASQARQPRLWEAQNQYWKTGFYGRGFVQLTWQKNYQGAGQKLSGADFTIDGNDVVVDASTFVRNPDFVLDTDVSYAICSHGMREGWFTGKRLGQFIIDGKTPDYLGARRIINGTDHAADIAGIANEFELLLRAASQS